MKLKPPIILLIILLLASLGFAQDKAKPEAKAETKTETVETKPEPKAEVASPAPAPPAQMTRAPQQQPASAPMSLPERVFWIFVDSLVRYCLPFCLCLYFTARLIWAHGPWQGFRKAKSTTVLNQETLNEIKAALANQSK